MVPPQAGKIIDIWRISGFRRRGLPVIAKFEVGRPSEAKASQVLRGLMYGLKPVPFT
jgi:hypothetical protein